MARTKKRDTMNPVTDAVFNEKGERGMADGFFCMEGPLYTAVLLAEKRWRTPAGRPRKQRVVQSFHGWSARELAKNLRDAGWAPPRGLARMCEAQRHAR